MIITTFVLIHWQHISCSFLRLMKENFDCHLRHGIKCRWWTNINILMLHVNFSLYNCVMYLKLVVTFRIANRNNKCAKWVDYFSAQIELRRLESFRITWVLLNIIIVNFHGFDRWNLKKNLMFENLKSFLVSVFLKIVIHRRRVSFIVLSTDDVISSSELCIIWIINFLMNNKSVKMKYEELFRDFWIIFEFFLPAYTSIHFACISTFSTKHKRII